MKGCCNQRFVVCPKDIHPSIRMVSIMSISRHPWVPGLPKDTIMPPPPWCQAKSWPLSTPDDYFWHMGGVFQREMGLCDTLPACVMSSLFPRPSLLFPFLPGFWGEDKGCFEGLMYLVCTRALMHHNMYRVDRFGVWSICCPPSFPFSLATVLAEQSTWKLTNKEGYVRAMKSHNFIVCSCLCRKRGEIGL